MKGNAMLCEIVFLFNSPLVAHNRLDQPGGSDAKPIITMDASPSADAHWVEVNALKDQFIVNLQGEALPGGDLTLKRARLGGVAHEVGTLRLGAGGTGVVDENLRYNGYTNLFVCDLSVFPTSPAANGGVVARFLELQPSLSR